MPNSNATSSKILVRIARSNRLQRLHQLILPTASSHGCVNAALPTQTGRVFVVISTMLGSLSDLRWKRDGEGQAMALPQNGPTETSSLDTAKEEERRDTNLFNNHMEK
mmetsp:Transcript_31851/g.74484  ORF Transcript_31851/g.74484 Transcript_31851/m.74484 type:complete len:108 (-) Transcript_31851:727-1050(-)